MARGAFARVASALASALACVVTFVVAAAGAVVLHLGSPPVRRLAQGIVATATHGALQGEIRVARLDELRLDGVGSVDAVIVDPEGTPVIAARGLSARLRTTDLLRSLLAGRGLVISLSEVTARSVDLSLHTDSHGELGLARAFAARTPTLPDPPKDAAKGGVRVHVARVTVGSVHVRGPAPESAGGVDVLVHDVDLGFDLDGAGMRTKATLPEVIVRAPRPDPRLAESRLTVRADVGWSMAKGALPEGDVIVEGDLAGASVHVDAKVHDQKLDVRVDPLRVPKAVLRVFEPGMGDDAVVRATVTGPLADAVVDVDVLLGKSHARALGRARLLPPFAMRGDVSVDALDLASVRADLPRSALDARVDYDVAIGPVERRATANVTVAKGTVAGERTPPVLARASWDGSAVRATVDATDDGVKLHADAAITALETSPKIAATARVEVADLARVRRLAALGVPLTGAATVDVDARADLGAKSLSADVDLRATSVGVAGTSVERLDLRASARGALESPHVVAAGSVHGVHAGSVDVEDATFGATVDVGAGAGPGAAVVVSDAYVRAPAHGRVRHELALALARLEIGERGLVADGLSGRAFGSAITGAAVRSRGGARVVLRAADVDLADLSRFFRLPRQEDDARASVDVDLDVRGRTVAGHVVAHASRVTAALVREVAVDVDVDFSGEAATGSVDVRAGEGLHATTRIRRLRWDGSPLDPRAWVRAGGFARTSGEIDLRALQVLVPTLPPDLAGDLHFDVGLRRARGEAAPSVDAAVRSAGLTFTSGELHVEGIDATLGATWDGIRGDAGAYAHVWDRGGSLVTLDARAILPGIFEANEATFEEFRDAALRAPMSVAVHVPSRRLATFPEFLGTRGLPGDLSVDVSARGSVVDPEIDATVGMRRLALHPRADSSVDAGLHASYDGRVVVAELDARNPTKADAGNLKARAVVALPFADVLAGRPFDDIPWRGDVDVHAKKFDVAPLARRPRDLAGAVDLDVVVRGLHSDARAEVKVDAPNLVVSGVRFERAEVKADTDGHTARANVFVAAQGGLAKAEATTGLVWGRALVPTLDGTKPSTASFDLQSFRLRALRPVLRGVLPRLDGRLEGHGNVALEGGKQVFEGEVSILDASATIPIMGETISHVQGRATIDREGRITLEGGSAELGGGKIDLAASARMQGIVPTGAAVAFRIPESKPIPLRFDGVNYGEASGEIGVELALEKRSLATTVRIPKLKVDLAELGARTLQSLDKDPTVKVVGEKAPETDADDGGDDTPFRTHVTVELGQDVRIQQGTQLRAQLTGKLGVDVAEAVKVEGAITIASGQLDVQGRRFTVDRGTITFHDGDDPSNPVVVASAFWDAPDGSARVFADFVGPAQTGKLTLRSEPRHSQGEILSLLLLGTADGGMTSSGRGGGSSTTTAISLGGGLATQGLNRALRDVTNLDIETRVATNDSQNPRPEVAFRVVKNVTAQIGYNVGATVPGKNPDLVVLTLDWAFAPRYFLVATAGDRGTTILDLLWRYRY
ncbi:MAG: translocation/assembly module TamB domain-containing protein [Polyangiaceae bacterium]